jgi:hypothetical protein
MSKLKISADTSQVKKSIMELGDNLKKMNANQKVTVFSSEERKFIKSELNAQFNKLKTNLGDSKKQVKELFVELSKVTKGSDKELQVKKKITDELKKQVKASKELSGMKSSGAGGGMGGGLGGSMPGGIVGKITAAAGAYAASIAYRSVSAFKQGAGSNISLQGLGVNPRSGFSARQLADSGLDVNSMMDNRVNATRVLGREGGSEQGVLGRASFERAKGLEGGSLMNVAGSLRGSFGGFGANDAQMKLQASILSSGIEDAIGPYLEAATDMLSNINENGVTSTTDIIAAFGDIARSGQRTVEQSAKLFGGIDSSIRGASGESDAFFQNAFGRAGIGGGAIGTTKFAMQAGGLAGLDSEALLNRGFDPALVADFENSNMSSNKGGASRRAGAITSQARQNLGMSGSFSGIKDARTAAMASQFGNSMFGTQGIGGLDALRLLEQLENKKITKKTFDKELEDIKNNTPELKGLTAINNSLSGQTNVLDSMSNSLKIISGETMVPAALALQEADNLAIKGAGNLVGGTTSMMGSLVKAIQDAVTIKQDPYTQKLNLKEKHNILLKNLPKPIVVNPPSNKL